MTDKDYSDSVAPLSMAAPDDSPKLEARCNETRKPWPDAKKNAIAWYGIIAALFLIFYLFNYLAPMMSDDYNYAFSFATRKRITQFSDILPSIAAHYNNSNGRLVTHFFAQLMLLIGKPVFNIINALMAVALLTGLCRLTSGRGRNPRQLALFGSVLIVLLPTLGQVMFWLVGACNYLWGSALIVWMIIPFRDNMLGEYRSPAWWQAALLLPLYLLMGATSENGSSAAILFMGLCCAYGLIRRRKVPVTFWISIALCVAGFILMLQSPASQRRNAASLLQGVSFFKQHYEPLVNAINMFINYAMIPSVVYLVLFSVAIGNRESKDRLALSVLLYLCGAASNFAMAATGYYPARAMTVCLLMILSASALLLPALRRTGVNPLLRGCEWALCLLALMLCLQAAPQTYDRYREAEIRATMVTAEREAGHLDVFTTNISSKSKFDVFYDMIDLTYDPDYFANAVFARYYGVNSVIVNELR